MSSRKRIKSVVVDEIVNQIKQMAGNECSLYRKLSCYDKVLKKYNIDSLNSIALQIYEYLIEQQTVATLPQKTKTKINTFKFSRSEIQLYQDQSINQYNNDEIEDPQTKDGKLFSFAKNNKQEHKRYIKEDQVQPRKLFMEKNNKFKSENKAKHYPSRLEKFQEQEFLDYLDKKPLKHSKSKSLKTLGKCSNSGSEKNLISKSFAFSNSENTKQIEKIEDLAQQQHLQHYLRVKRIRQFLLRLSVDRQQTHYQAILKRVKYIYCMKLFSKSFQSLKKYCEVSLQRNKKVRQFRQIRDECFMQEVFLEWRALSVMNQRWKERIEMIDENFGYLCSYLFVNRLKLVAHMARGERRRKEVLKEELQSNAEILLKRIFYQSFAFKFQKEIDTTQRSNQIKKLRLYNHRRYLTRNLKNYLYQQKERQTNSMNKVIFKICGKRLLKNLINEQNFMQVYWKHKDQLNKIIFMDYLLRALRSRFKRLGYQYPWMRMLDKNMQSIDCKLRNILSRHKKLQIFNRLALNHAQQKQKRDKVKAILMDGFLKRLTYSHYLKFKKQSQTNKQNELVQFLYVKYGAKLLTKVMKVEEKLIERKYTKLRCKLFNSKSNEFFIYLEAYKRTKHHYTEILESFQLKRQMRFLYMVWTGFKRILKGEIINKKLVTEYLKLKDKVMLQNCFEALKNNIFQEKLFRKKEKNFIKLVKLRSFDQLLKRLTQNLKYEPFKKKEIQYEFGESLQKRRKLYFLQIWRTSFQQSQLSNTIEQQLVQNYQTHLVKKCFQVMKFVTVKSKQQQQLFIEIKRRSVMRRKQNVFDRMLQITVKRHSIRLFCKITEKIVNTKMRQNLNAALMLFIDNNSKEKERNHK